MRQITFSTSSVLSQKVKLLHDQQSVLKLVNRFDKIEPRRLNVNWSLEMAQDLRAPHSIDVEEELTDMLSYSIREEIANTSPLARTNVRTLINHVERQVEGALENFLFEENNEVTRNQIQATLTNQLSNLQNRRVINGASITVNDDLTIEITLLPTTISPEPINQPITLNFSMPRS